MSVGSSLLFLHEVDTFEKAASISWPHITSHNTSIFRKVMRSKHVHRVNRSYDTAVKHSTFLFVNILSYPDPSKNGKAIFWEVAQEAVLALVNCCISRHQLIRSFVLLMLHCTGRAHFSLALGRYQKHR